VRPRSGESLYSMRPLSQKFKNSQKVSVLVHLLHRISIHALVRKCMLYAPSLYRTPAVFREMFSYRMFSYRMCALECVLISLNRSTQCVPLSLYTHRHTDTDTHTHTPCVLLWRETYPLHSHTHKQAFP
jgi:hypothetical protein